MAEVEITLPKDKNLGNTKFILEGIKELDQVLEQAKDFIANHPWVTQVDIGEYLPSAISALNKVWYHDGYYHNPPKPLLVFINSSYYNPDYIHSQDEHGLSPGDYERDLAVTLELIWVPYKDTGLKVLEMSGMCSVRSHRYPNKPECNIEQGFIDVDKYLDR